LRSSAPATSPCCPSCNGKLRREPSRIRLRRARPETGDSRIASLGCRQKLQREGIVLGVGITTGSSPRGPEPIVVCIQPDRTASDRLFLLEDGRIPGSPCSPCLSVCSWPFPDRGFVESLPFFLVLGSRNHHPRSPEKEIRIEKTWACPLPACRPDPRHPGLVRPDSGTKHPDIVRAYVGDSIKYSIALYEEIGLPRIRSTHCGRRPEVAG